MPAELTRKSQPIRIRPISRNASLALVAMPSAWDRTGSDDSLAWLDMVSLMVSPMIQYRWFATVKSQAHDNAWRSLPRACARSEFPSDQAVERPSAAAADQEEQRAEADQQRVFRAALRPEKALCRGEFHAHDHEDDDGSRRKARKQSQHQQGAADQFGAADQRAPEYAGREADPIEQRGVAGKAHAAECSEQLLHAVRNEDRAERDAQDRFGILVDRAVNVAECGNVVTRCCFGHRRAPSMVLFLACAFTGCRWTKAAALDDSLGG